MAPPEREREASPAGAGPLRQLQELFHGLVTAPEDIERTLASRRIPRAVVEQAFVGDARLSAVERLDVYAQMYFFRLFDVLVDQFPALAACVGETQFHDLVTDYLVACPPASPNIRDVGQRLAAHLADSDLAEERPWLTELAQLEWAHIELFDGPDAEPLTLADLHGLAPDELARLPLALVPCARVMRCAYRVDRIWERIAERDDETSDGALDNEAPEGDGPEDDAIEPPPREPARVLLWRQWKRPRTRFNELRKRGLDEVRAATSAYNGFGPWWNAGASHMNQAVPISTLQQMGLVSLLDQHRRLKCNS